MSCGKCSKGAKLCPVSFGLALGITAGLAVLFWSIWLKYQGVPSMMGAHAEAATAAMQINWVMSVTYALWGLLKGFVFGFVLALIYDCIVCCGKSKKSCECCGKSKEACDSGMKK